MTDPLARRIAALLLVLAGALVILNDATHLAYGGTSFAEAAAAASTTHYVHGGSHVAYGLLLLAGLAAFAYAERKTLGPAGVGVALVAATAYGLMACAYYAYTFAGPLLADADPALLDVEPPLAVFGFIAFVPALLGMASTVALGGLVAWRMPSLRWPAIVLALGAVLFFALIGIPAGPEAVLGLGFLGIGVMLARRAA